MVIESWKFLMRDEEGKWTSEIREKQKQKMLQRKLQNRKTIIKIKGLSKEEFNFKYPTPQDFYNSLEWAKCRIFILKRDNFTCRICNLKPCGTVHHLNSPFYFPEICFDPENLIVVCRKCHNEYHQNNQSKNNEIFEVIKNND